MTTPPGGDLSGSTLRTKFQVWRTGHKTVKISEWDLGLSTCELEDLKWSWS
jgi:hypothetical protein